MHLLMEIAIKLFEDAAQIAPPMEEDQRQYVSVYSSVINPNKSKIQIGKQIEQNNKSAIAKETTNFVAA